MNKKSLSFTAFIFMSIISTCSTNPIPTNRDNLNFNIKSSELKGCMRTDFSNVEFFNIKVTGLNDRELKDHQSGNSLKYSNLQVSGDYTDENNQPKEFSLIMSNVKFIIELSSSIISEVTSAKVDGIKDLILKNEALRKCISEVHALLDNLALEYAKIHLVDKVL